MKVLHIEDDASNRRLIYMMLERDGHEFFSTSDGLSGIAVAEREQPDVILIDIHLPDIDGIEVCRRLRANPLFTNTPMITITANAMDGDRAHLLASGFDGYIAKPVNRVVLMTTIEHAVQQRRGT